MGSSNIQGACRAVIIFGDCWPEVMALRSAYLSPRRMPACPDGQSVLCCHDAGQLAAGLEAWPQAGVLLCLRPHEQVHFLAQAGALLQGHPVVVVVRERLWPVDRWVMRVLYGGVPVVACDPALLKTGPVRYPRGSDPELLAFRETLPGRFYIANGQGMPGGICHNDRVAWINRQVTALMALELSAGQLLAVMLLETYGSLSAAASGTGIPLQTLSGHYVKMVRRLGLPVHPVSRQRGLLVRPELQRHVFAGQAGQEKPALSVMAGV
ncbi:TPA: hypothetical protein N3A33_005287 [Salmonella enterica subsp. salamae serovar 28:r:e,n,z15]|nr:hypothetical protein [Salmonella enterica subsp. salamae serovar 28:r:e,n,z15]